MKNKRKIVEAIPEWMFRNEMFYLIVGSVSLLVFEWLKVRVFPNKQP
jgi:hypothetical protein